MTARPVKFVGMNHPASYASFVAGPGTMPRNSGWAGVGRFGVFLMGGLLLLSALYALLR